LLLLHPSEVVLDLFLLMSLDALVVGGTDQEVFCLDELKTQSPVPLLEHFLVFLRCVEGRCRQLEGPERNVAVRLSHMYILLELVYNDLLVIDGASERPYVVFFKPMVNVNEVRVHRVGVKVLTLDVIPVEDFVVVVHWDDCGGANDVLWLGDEGLKSFVGVNLVKRDIIPVMVLMRVVMDRLVHATEWLIDVWMIELTREQVVDRHGNSLVRHHVLARVLVLRGEVVNSCTEALSETVLMDSPHLIHFLGHLLTCELASHKGRAKSPQKDVPRVKLEHRYD